MAVHMLIMGVTREKEGKEHFLSAAFPSACGKTNMAMLEPSIPGYKVRVVGDDIGWMRFDKDGQLRGINPEAGFFGLTMNLHFQFNQLKVSARALQTKPIQWQWLHFRRTRSSQM